MAVLSVQDEFQSGDNVTATNLNNLVKDASFNADTTDNSTLEVHTSGYLKVKDSGVQTQHIGNDQVTYGKMQDVAAYSVIGNNTNATATPTAIAIDDLKDNISNATTSADGLMSSTDKNKLDGIAAGATANSSDATLLSRANHTGTQTAATISDFDTEVANNTAVAANTAKVSNATHTGDVTGSTALTIANNAVTFAKMQQISNRRVIGNMSGAIANPEPITIIDDDTMGTAANNSLATSESIKAYVDAQTGASVYTSSETSIPATNTTQTWTHSLGQAPDSIQLILRCKTAEYGYSVGDEIRFTSEYTYNVGVYTFWANASTIGFRHYTAAGTVFNIVDRSVANTVRNPTPANWRIVVKGIVF